MFLPGGRQATGVICVTSRPLSNPPNSELGGAQGGVVHDHDHWPLAVRRWRAPSNTDPAQGLPEHLKIPPRACLDGILSAGARLSGHPSRREWDSNPRNFCLMEALPLIRRLLSATRAPRRGVRPLYHPYVARIRGTCT